MTTTYDPFDPAYFDADDLDQELDRVYDLCHGCRLCFKFCDSFPLLFSYVDAHEDQDVSRLTQAQKVAVVDECFQCKLCYINCPYVPGKHEWALDFPRLMMRAEQVRRRSSPPKLPGRVTDAALANTDLAGRMGSLLAPLANRLVGTPGSAPRRLMQKALGISEVRLLPPYQRTRFSTWFKRRDPQLPRRSAGDDVAVVFPTCLVEYQHTEVGRDLVSVYERNGIPCEVAGNARCCGAPALHQGDVDTFRKTATRTAAALADAVRSALARGVEPAIVVPQPTCGYVLKRDYPDYIPGSDAQLVSEHTYDAAEYLMMLHKDPEREPLNLEFDGEIPVAVTYHAPCHLRAQEMGLRSRDLMKLTGSKVTVVAECSGIDGTWGLRQENIEASRKVAKKMVKAIEATGPVELAGDCSLANGGIELETGRRPLHPLSFVARAYGVGGTDTPRA